jgi:hypothetical protein
MTLHTFKGTGSPDHAATEATESFNAWASKIKHYADIPSPFGGGRVIPIYPTVVSVATVFIPHADAAGTWGEFFIHALEGG